MQLNVKTRGNSRIDGKTKIYVSCYNNNRFLAVERICGWIFKVRNYAIYYPEDTRNFDIIEHRENLMLMNCILIPIFPNDMEEDTNSNMDYQFAINNNIPVVTILMEENESPDFYNKYQRIYGNMQLMVPYSKDLTKIPFDQVLIQYLEKVTSDDVESYQKYQEEGYYPQWINQEAKNEFRGSAFISYRKKNRRFVNDLIHELHKESELLDIMFWYDEYLIPGESFSDALRDSIVNSDLVLLIVTPDILEDSNYVLTHEYPLACESDQLIIALEYEEVEETILRKKFPELDYYFKKEDIELFPDILAQLFRGIKGSQKPIEGKRAFMLGKAYMDGKLVEINRNRGIEFIKKAAEDAFVPAMRTMINIYEHGNGVKANPDLRLMWEQKLEFVLKKNIISKSGTTTENLDVLMGIYEKQGRAGMECGDFKGAMESYKQMFQCATEICQLNKGGMLGDIFSTYVILACNNIANASMQLEDYKQARTYLECAFEYYDKYYRNDISLGGNVAIAETWKWLGNLESAEDKKQQALECYEQALQYIEAGPNIYQLSRANETTRCEIHELMGWLNSDLDKMQDALLNFEHSLEIAERLNAEFPDTGSELCVIRANYAIGSIFKKNNQLKDAIRFFTIALTYAEKNVDKAGKESFYNLVFDYSVEIASCLYSQNCNLEAYEYLQKAEKMLEKIGTKIAALDKLLLFYNLCGNIVYSQNKPATSRQYYRKLLEYSKISYEMKHDIQSLANLGVAYYKLSTANPYITDWISIDNACNIYRFLSNEVPEQRQFVSTLNKIITLQSEKYATLKENHQKISRWSDHMFKVAHTIESYGLSFSDDTSLHNRIEADILEMVVMIIVNETERVDDISQMLTLVLGQKITPTELSRYIFMKRLFISDKSSLLTLGIPKSIQFAVQLMKSIGNRSMDYHEDYPFDIRIVMWSIGEWTLDIINAKSNQREDFIDYFDEIDYFIESNVSVK